MAMRHRRVWRQMVGVSRVVNGNERQKSLESDVGVSRVVSGNERQRSLETDGWSQ